MDEFYEIINGKKYKKCKENQIRNPISRRCIYKDKKTAKDILLNEKNRPKYLLKYIKIKSKKKNISLSPKEDNEKRIYNYKKIINNIHDIDNDIKIGDKIEYGNDGNMFLSFLKKNPKYNFVSMIIIDNKKSENQIKYLKILNDVIINKRSFHFPLLYGIYDYNIKQNELIKLPKLLKVENNDFKLILFELLDGNLKNFLIKMNKNDNVYLNALTQVFLSLIFLYKETKSFHNNSKWDNFLYKKINKGGYYHYEIMGEKYYLENLGYLWMISDYENCIDFKNSIYKNIRINLDFEKIIYSFLPSYYNGIIKEKNYKLSQKSVVDILKILNIVKTYSELYTLTGMKIFIKKILNTFVKYGFMKSNVDSVLIINKIPYKYNIN